MQERFLYGYGNFKMGQVVKSTGGKKIKYYIVTKVEIDELLTQNVSMEKLSKWWFKRMYQIIVFKLQTK